MTNARTSGYLAECFWPGVAESDLRLLDERITEAAADLLASGVPVRYLGSMLMRDDEVVLCLFEGSQEAVRAAVERAAVPFERILETLRSPWPAVERP